jgi:hypothetical protein
LWRPDVEVWVPDNSFDSQLDFVSENTELVFEGEPPDHMLHVGRGEDEERMSFSYCDILDIFRDIGSPVAHSFSISKGSPARKKALLENLKRIFRNGVTSTLAELEKDGYTPAPLHDPRKKGASG